MSEKKPWTQKTKIGEKVETVGKDKKLVPAYIDEVSDEALKRPAAVSPLKVAAAVEKRVKARDEIWAAMEKIIDAFAETYQQALRHDLETYQLLTKPDCLYGDSPISEGKLRFWVRQYLFKKDMDFLSGLQLDGKPAMWELTKRCEESSRWIMRFTKEPEKEKSGAEKILEGKKEK